MPLISVGSPNCRDGLIPRRLPDMPDLFLMTNEIARSVIITSFTTVKFVKDVACGTNACVHVPISHTS